MLFYIRLSLFIGALITCGYSLFFMKKNCRPSYFKCVFYGFVSYFLATVYYLILSADSSLNQTFSLGVFGEVGLFLFVSAANLTYIPKEIDEEKKKYSIKGIIVSSVFFTLWSLPIIFDHSIGNIVVCILFSFSSSFCLYSCISVLENKYQNELKKAIKPFILTMVVIILTFYAYQILLSINTKVCLYIAGFGVNGIGILGILVSMYLLKKGLEPWEI